MNAWLYNILRDGRLKDNQTYIAEDGVIGNNARMGLIELERRGYRQRSGPHNNEEALWRFLTEISKEIATCLRLRPSDSVVLFNAGEYEHNTDDEFIKLHGTNVCNFRITTGNLIGCVKRGDYSLKISSRFGDAFLRYIIADADGFLELEDFGGEELNGGYEWLLAYLWMIKLKRAFRLGLPKAYNGKTEATSLVRGQLDPVRYFMDGDRGTYLCSYREHSYSNPQAVLISEAYRRLKPHSLLRGMHTVASNFTVAAAGSRPSRRELLATRHFTNPFYSDYNDVIELSKRVLRSGSTDFGDDSETSAFFFDVSMLFEYFVRKLIRRSGAQLRPKTDRLWEIPSGRRIQHMRKLEPDLLFTINGRTCVFDVKYKSFDFREGVDREDLFQLHTYVGQCSNVEEVAACGLIYPISAQRWDHEGLEASGGAISDEFRLAGRRMSFHILFIRVPNEGPLFGLCFKASCDRFLRTMETSAE